jgi:hypothetical protein
MPVSHQFYTDHDILLTRWSGRLQESELLRDYLGIYNHSHWHPGYNEIIDLRDADLSALEDDALEQLGELTANCLQGAQIKLAIIAPSDLSPDVARLYRAFTHIPNESTRLCHHLDEALEWLQALASNDN